MDTKIVGIKVEGCEDLDLNGNQFLGLDEAIILKDTKHVKIEGNIISSEDKSYIINEIMKELNVRFQKEKLEKKSNKLELLKDTLSKIAADVISEVIVKSIK